MEEESLNTTNNIHTSKKSEEVVHIIEHMPTRFGWSVLYLVSFLVLLMFTFSWIIKYPEVLRGDISITSQKSNVNIISNVNGKIRLLSYKNGEMISSGNIIGYIENEAELNDILTLDTLLKTYQINDINILHNRNVYPSHLNLGEINAKYYSFLNSYYQYIDYHNNLPFSKEFVLINQSINSKKLLLKENDSELAQLKKKAETAKRINQRDSVLQKNKVLSKSDYDKSTIASITVEQEIANINRERINTEYQIHEDSNKIKQFQIQRIEKERELEVVLNNNYHELKENLQLWFRKYAFIAPIDGKIDFMNFIKDQYYAQAGQSLFSIVPNQNNIVGEMMLPDYRAGKVIIGQDVIVKLNNYPFTEYGSVKGMIKSISLISNQQAISSAQSNYVNQIKVNSYLVSIDFPDGLKTNYGTKLQFHFEAKGSGEIVINKRRLIERMFDNIKYRVK